ncbi:carbohydrate ABC transporter permease [Aquipuribacter sp. SD81]|uniref:carbohydrate ABC transporter permease n=1 Tax=Aquipuribacter sp. SD81 TaxID=3127703 RepID=UPI00301B2F8C
MSTLTRTGTRPARRPTAGGAVAALVHAVFVVFFALPLLWLLLAATRSGASLVRDAPLSPGSLGQLAENWRSLVGFQDAAILTWVGNSAYYSLAALALTLLVSIPAGYALALTRFRARRTLLLTTLVVMLMPNTALVLPVFLEMNAVGLIGTAAAVVLPFSFFPFGVYLAYIYFSSSISRSLLEAARIDGCGELRLFLHIALPLSAPVVALVGFFSFVQNWNNYFLPFVMLPSSDDYPVQIGLSALLSSTPAFNPSAAGAAVIDLPTLALATIVSVLPVLLVFAFAQRFLVTGLTAGGVKG